MSTGSPYNFGHVFFDEIQSPSTLKIVNLTMSENHFLHKTLIDSGLERAPSPLNDISDNEYFLFHFYLMIIFRPC